MKLIITTFAVLLINALSIFSQFDIEQYKEYLKSHQDMTVDELLKEYPAGYFKYSAPTNFSEANFSGRMDSVLRLTAYEKELINKHGFMVTERLEYNTFQSAFEHAWNTDLPVYISADAILHAMHYSFNDMLKDIEKNCLIRILYTSLNDLYNQTSNLSKAGNSEIFNLALKDYDLYVTMALNLLNYDNLITLEKKPYFSDNTAMLNTLLANISNLQPSKVKLFADNEREIDFSQFKPRGHYTEDEELQRYFKCMIWLGRTEILITNPVQHKYPDYSEKDLKRQLMLGALLTESAGKTEALDLLKIMEDILVVLIGRQDNISIFEMDSVMKLCGTHSAMELEEQSKTDLFQSELLKLQSATQLYNSQILYSNPDLEQQIETPSAFLLMCQRPILDGFLTRNVVYDKIIYQGRKVSRMLPSTLDILFAFGNDAAIQLLEPELRTFPYSMNLAALRYLINGYDSDFWNSTCYNNWLSAIKGLNPTLKREGLPLFMQTAAWWQKSMNTQLASWSQLRHDYILYAKQPYSAGSIGCSYPDGFVEPVPETYKSISLFAQKTINAVDKIPQGYDKDDLKSKICYVLNKYILTCEKLVELSLKELSNEPFNSTDLIFLNSVTHEYQMDVGCGFEPANDGWYYELFYEGYGNRGWIKDECDYAVADVHTAPTDDEGNPVGWVLHGGTGMVNMAVIVTNGQDGKPCTFAGPVMSYYETITENYKRLTDEEWETYHKGENSRRPAFTNLYLADGNGGERPNQVSLLVGVEDEHGIIKNKIFADNYPNPFSSTTQIHFNVPPDLSNQLVQLNIYTVDGKLIKNIISVNLPLGNYSFGWDASDMFGNKVNAGVYIYNLQIGDMQETGKMVLLDK